MLVVSLFLSTACDGSKSAGLKPPRGGQNDTNDDSGGSWSPDASEVTPNVGPDAETATDAAFGTDATAVDPPMLAGTTSSWSGASTFGKEISPTAFDLSLNASGEISGIHAIFDPATNARINVGVVAGTLSGNHASWSTQGGVVVDGYFMGASFDGTISYPGSVSVPGSPVIAPLTAQLHLAFDGRAP
jgi:hypothetical protein